MFSELPSPFSALFDELMRRPGNLKLKYFLERMTLCDVWKCLLWHFFEGVDLKIQLSQSLKGVNIRMTLPLWMEIKKVWSVVFCVERPSEEGAPIG